MFIIIIIFIIIILYYYVFEMKNEHNEEKKVYNNHFETNLYVTMTIFISFIHIPSNNRYTMKNYFISMHVCVCWLE